MTLSLFIQGLILLAVMHALPGLFLPEQLSYWGFLVLAVALVGWTYWRGRQGRGPIW